MPSTGLYENRPRVRLGPSGLSLPSLRRADKVFCQEGNKDILINSYINFNKDIAH